MTTPCMRDGGVPAASTSASQVPVLLAARLPSPEMRSYAGLAEGAEGSRKVRCNPADPVTSPRPSGSKAGLALVRPAPCPQLCHTVRTGSLGAVAGARTVVSHGQTDRHLQPIKPKLIGQC